MYLLELYTLIFFPAFSEKRRDPPVLTRCRLSQCTMGCQLPISYINKLASLFFFHGCSSAAKLVCWCTLGETSQSSFRPIWLWNLKRKSVLQVGCCLTAQYTCFCHLITLLHLLYVHSNLLCCVAGFCGKLFSLPSLSLAQQKPNPQDPEVQQLKF